MNFYAAKVASPAPSAAPMRAEAAMDVAAQAPSSMVLDRKTLGNRKIAETHNLSIETSPEDLQPRYQRDFNECVKRGCQIMNSNIASESGGQIQARIDPEKLGAFLDFLAEGPGKIESHQVSADDYTMEYSDVSVTLENLKNLHDRMSALLTRAEAIDDILRIEQELNRIQTQMDQNTARLRILQTMTQMATVYISYSVQYSPADIKPYELKNTWKNAVNKFLRGIDHMIQFIGATLPWIPVIFISVWLGIRAVRFAFARVSIRLPWRKNQR